MAQSYGKALSEIACAINRGGAVLDCGAHSGHMFDKLAQRTTLSSERYFGVEWDQRMVEQAQQRGLQVKWGDLNKGIPYEDGTFSCVYALSLLEHLLNGCRFMKECHRVLADDGTLILLTPNIATYFTAMLVLMGKMPSSGPHPDSDALVKKEEIFKVSGDAIQPDTERDTPVHRHLVVFSYRVLRDYLHMIGFRDVRGYGFGLYPFPNFIQPLLEQIDPYHCHQMVFIAQK
jgi:SAM-dependent methyltransferase